ncbi:MAG: nuclear transport factor 2 family protein [Burkholderiaceae bacterium]
MARLKRPLPQIDTPDQIEQRFYEALQRGDIDGLMSVWAEDEDISCVHPGGPRLIGHGPIRSAFESIFANGAVDASARKVRRLQSGSCAVHSVLEQIRVKTAEGPQLAWVVATNVYLQGATGWRMVAHHASPGTEQELQEQVEAASVLH